MPALTGTLKEKIRALKARLKEKIEALPESGRVWGRVRFALDLREWLAIAAVTPTDGKDIVRATFIYWTGWNVTGDTCRNKLVSATFAFEVLQGFEDGTNEENSTQAFEDYLAELIEVFALDPQLGFTEEGGVDVSHTQLQGADGEARPEYVDGVLCHRKIPSITITFTI